MTATRVRLEFEPSAGAASRQRTERETEWRDEYGAVAFGWSDGRRSSMRLPGVGVYRWTAPGDEVRVAPEPDSTRATVVDTFHRCVLPMVLQTQGRQVLHASAVLLPDGVLALCARSRTGKSTLAYALSRDWRRPLWADDAVAFEANGDDGATSIPLPFELKLRDPSATHFGVQRPPTAERRLAGAPAPMRAALTLRRSDAVKAPRATRLTDAKAFTALLEHGYCFDVDQPAMHERMVSQYLELSARVPVYELEYPSGFEALPDTLALIRETLAC